MELLQHLKETKLNLKLQYEIKQYPNLQFY